MQESTWITKSILDTVLGEGGKKTATRAVIVLSQADSYAETIRLYGGPKGVLDKYLPNVASCNGFLDVIAVNALFPRRYFFSFSPLRERRRSDILYAVFTTPGASLTQLVECHLAKVVVEGSSPLARSILGVAETGDMGA